MVTYELVTRFYELKDLIVLGTNTEIDRLMALVNAGQMDIKDFLRRADLLLWANKHRN